MSIIICTNEEIFGYLADEQEILAEKGYEKEMSEFEYNSYDQWEKECGDTDCCDPDTTINPTSDSKGGKLSIHDIDNANHQTLLVLDHKNANGAFESRASRVEQSVNGYNIKADIVHVNDENGENVSAKDVREAAKDAGYNGVLTYRSV